MKEWTDVKQAKILKFKENEQIVILLIPWNVGEFEAAPLES